jgi:O-acetyl-ADP-ribose deacetylase (regulator of RNase III)
MVIETSGNILDAKVDAIVNTVNTKGVMGAGLALQVRQRHPDVLKAYEAACASGDVAVGKLFVVPIQGQTQRWVVNLPTKRHWRSPSRIEDVEAGLDALVAWVREEKVESIAVPPLGAGLGRLPWDQVKSLMVEKLSVFEDVRVEMFLPLEQPGTAPSSKAKPASKGLTTHTS